jgi:sugar phosphate permease
VQGLPSLTPFIQATLRLTRAQVGFVTSSIWIGMTVSAIPIGMILDRIGVRRTLLGGLLVLGAFATLASFAGTPSILYGCLFIAGAGFTTVYPSTTKAVMYWAPVKARATFMGIKQTGVSVGGALAAMVLPVSALAAGWRLSLMSVGLGVAGLGVACYLLYREHPLERVPLSGDGGHSHEGAARAGEGQARSAFLSATLKSANVWALNISGLLLMTCQICIITWLILFLKTEAGYDVVRAGRVLATVQAGAIAGRLGLGPLSDWLFGGKRKPLILVVQAIVAALLAVVSTFNEATPAWMVFGVAGILGCAALGWVPLEAVLRAEIAGREATGTVMTVGTTVMSLGSAFGPPLFGLLADATGGFKLSWVALAGASCLSLLFMTTVREGEPLFGQRGGEAQHSAAQEG